MSLPQSEQVFPFLEELYFAFNEVLSEDKLFYAVTQLPNLKYLVITGNPFALQQQQAQNGAAQGSVSLYAGAHGPVGSNQISYTQTLQMLLEQKGGLLINEVLNPPGYLRKNTAGAVTTAAKATTRGTTMGTSNANS